MAVSNIVKNNVAGSIKFIDGTTPVAIELTLQFDKGDFALSGAKEKLNANVAIERRGKRKNTVHGARVYPTFSFTSWVSEFQDDGSTPGDVGSWVTRSGAYAGLVPVATPGATAPADVPFGFDIEYSMRGTTYGDASDHNFTLGDCEVTSFGFTEAEEGNSFSIGGDVRGAITGDLPMSEIS